VYNNDTQSTPSDTNLINAEYKVINVVINIVLYVRLITQKSLPKDVYCVIATAKFEPARANVYTRWL